MKICGAPMCKCYNRAKKEMFEQDLVKGLTNEKAKTFRKMCNCLPDCTSIMYDISMIDRMQAYQGLFDKLGAATTKP